MNPSPNPNQTPKQPTKTNNVTNPNSINSSSDKVKLNVMWNLVFFRVPIKMVDK